MKQKEIFLQSEGDAWFVRNRQSVASRKLPDDDSLLREIRELPIVDGRLQILEVGCGDGSWLAWLMANRDADCYGIEPSGQAVAAACARGINAMQGSADELPFENQSFDIVIFDFCLYRCDRGDLFRIASEADRVLRSPGWLVIMDFYSLTPRARTCHHRPCMQSYKMDYRSLFAWHLDCACMTHKVRHHGAAGYTDDPEEWVAVSVLRKRQRESAA